MTLHVPDEVKIECDMCGVTDMAWVTRHPWDLKFNLPDGWTDDNDMWHFCPACSEGKDDDENS